MDAFSQLLNGFAVALTPMNLLWCLVGTTLGTAIGVLPGLGPALTIALLLPITFKVEPTAAFILFAGIYYGAMYGGSTTSILLNTPGESATIVTALEGHKMARNGRAGAALATAAIGSFVAGTIGTLGITFLAPVVVDWALKFGPADYFSLMVFAFVTVSAVLGSSAVRGLATLFFGIWLGLIGVDLQTGQARFTFGLPELLDGINVVVVAVGPVALKETLYVASRYRFGKDEIIPLSGSLWMTLEERKRSWKPWLRGAAIGFPIGAMPAGGAEIPTFLSYYVEKKLSSKPQEFGKGAIEGVAGPEAANNASAAGVLVPMLTLGLPTSATAAIMLGVPELRHQSGTAIAAVAAAAGVGPDCFLVHRQRHAARAQPAADRDLGEAPAHPGASALCRHSRVRHHRHLWDHPVSGRSHPALSHRRHRLSDAPLRLPGRARHHRDDSGAAGGAKLPSGHDDLGGRLDGILHAPAVGDDPGAGRARFVRAQALSARHAAQARSCARRRVSARTGCFEPRRDFASSGRCNGESHSSTTSQCRRRASNSINAAAALLACDQLNCDPTPAIWDRPSSPSSRASAERSAPVLRRRCIQGPGTRRCCRADRSSIRPASCSSRRRFQFRCPRCPAPD